MKRWSRIAILSLQSLLYTLPFLVVICFSFLANYQYPQLWAQKWTLTHWLELGDSSTGLGYSLPLSAIISIVVALSATVLGFVISRHLYYSRFRHRTIRLAYFPFILTPVIYAVILQYFFILANLSGTVLGVVIAQLLITFPFAFLFFVGFWNHRVKEMEGLVQTLGGSQGQVFWKFLVPYAKGPLMTCFFQTFLISWFEYGLTSIIGIGKVKTITIQVFQYLNASNIYLAAVSSVLLILPPLVLLWTNRKTLLRVQTHEL